MTKNNIYKRGMIYKIIPISREEGAVYIGSTTKRLSTRLSQHKAVYSDWLKNNKLMRVSSFTLFEKYGVDNCIIELVTEYPCENQMQLRRQEGEIIRQTVCVNKLIAGRTRKEYNQDNKEKIARKQKEYENNNKERLDIKKKEWHIKNIKKTMESNKKLYDKKIMYHCGCGTSCNKTIKSKHFKSKTHIKWYKTTLEYKREQIRESTNKSIKKMSLLVQQMKF